MVMGNPSLGCGPDLDVGVQYVADTADHGGYKFIAYVLTILPHILSLQKDAEDMR